MTHASNSSSSDSTVTVVGSRKLERIPIELLTMMQFSFPEQATVFLRHPLHKKPQRFERMVALACDHFAIHYEWRQPEPGGRAQVFYRDIDMVGRSGLVLAFFADDLMTGGTEHVVEKAIDQMVPSYSYGIRDGRLRLLGSHDPYDIWGRVFRIGV